MKRNLDKIKLKDSKGITLIALVITIIVLLILAGVAISSITGENGIITKAKEAKEKMEDAKNEEARIMEEYESYMENEINGDGTGKVVSISSITAENYGDVIKGYSVLEGDYKVDSWKIFLKNDDGVWIMASDCVKLDPETANLDGVKMTTDGYSAYWSSSSIPNNGETYDNGNCAKALSNTENWTRYVDTNLATKAMGGATIEMFRDSYNAKYPSKTIECAKYSYGYGVKWSSGDKFEYGITELEATELLGTGAQCRLASSGTFDATEVMTFDYSSIDAAPFYASLGVRPIVCLKSDIQVMPTTSKGVTTWTIK